MWAADAALHIDQAPRGEERRKAFNFLQPSELTGMRWCNQQSPRCLPRAVDLGRPVDNLLKPLRDLKEGELNEVIIGPETPSTGGGNSHLVL